MRLCVKLQNTVLSHQLTGEYNYYRSVSRSFMAGLAWLNETEVEESGYQANIDGALYIGIPSTCYHLYMYEALGRYFSNHVRIYHIPFHI